MQNPDFVAISKGFGVESARVSEREMLGQAIETMFSTPGPYVLEVRVMKEENVYPMVPSGGSVTEIQLGDDR